VEPKEEEVMAAPYLPGKTAPGIPTTVADANRSRLNTALSIVLGMLVIIGVGFCVITKTNPRWLGFVFSASLALAIAGIVCNRSRQHDRN
jgi:hypothetical protein